MEEVKSLMLDINAGKNKELMESCKYLNDYSIFVGKVREYKRKCQELSIAIDKAMEYCIKQDIMKDILEKHRSEVARLIFREFDEAEFLEQQQKETENLKAEIKLAIDRAEQSERQTKLAIEEAQRLRKILEEHGWSD